MVMKDWLGLYEENERIEKSYNGSFVDIVICNLDIHFAIEDALIDIYLNYEDKKLICLEINKIILIFDRGGNSKQPYFEVFGRKYIPGSDVFLMPSELLGRISTEKWGNYPSFYRQMQPIIEGWITILS